MSWSRASSPPSPRRPPASSSTRPRPTPGELASLATKAAAVPGVKAVSTFEHLGGSLWESNVALSSAPLSPAAQRTVNDLQSLHGPGQLTVVGQTASFLSLQSSLKSHLPVVLGLIVLIALVMLFAMTRSVVLPLMAVVMNVLTIGATFGMLVWAFQWGHLSHLLGIQRPGCPAVDVTHHHPRRGLRALDRLRRLPPRAHEGGA